MRFRLCRIEPRAIFRASVLFFSMIAIAFVTAQTRGDGPSKPKKRAPGASKPTSVSSGAIPINEIKHPRQVDFQSEVLPVLRQNCIACHNSAKAENRLILETPQSILKGGESGPAVAPKHAIESLLLIAAAHLDDPTMPPANNTVKARNLTPNELGLIKLWIDQGATGQVARATPQIQWQRLAPTIRPILAAAVSPDGELAACGRDNEIYVYGIGSGALVARLVDPSLAGQLGAGGPGVAHLDLVQSLAFQPSGDLLASGGFREVKFWQRPRNVRIASLADSDHGRRGALAIAAVNPAGNLAAIGDSSGAIQLWQLPGGKLLRTISAHTAAVTGLQFSPDGETLYSSSLDKSLRAWNPSDGAATAQIETPAAVNAMALARRGRQICCGGADSVVRVWDVAEFVKQQRAKVQTNGGPATTVKTVRELRGHSGPVTALATSGDGSQIVSGGADGTVRFWNLKSGKQTKQVQHRPAVVAVAIRADGKRFATAGADNVVRLWNGENNQKIAELRGDFRNDLEVGRLTRAADVAHSGVDEAKRVLTDAENSAKQETDELKKTTDAKAAAQKDLAAKTAASKVVLDLKAKAEKELAAARDVAKTAADKLAAAKSAATKDAKNKDLAKAVAAATDAATAAQRKLAQAKSNLEQTTKNVQPPLAARKQAEDALVAAASDVKRVEPLVRKTANVVPGAKQNLATAQHNAKRADAAVQSGRKTAAERRPIRALAFSPDGFFLAIGGDNHLAQTVSADNGSPGDTFEGATSAVESLAYLTSGELLAVVSDRSAILWNTDPPWPLVRTIGTAADPTTFVDRVISLDFSPDGRLLATGGGYPSRSGELKIWNVAEGTLARSVPEAHSDTICAVRFSPDGKLVATGATDRTMKVFDVARGTLQKTFEGHSGHVLGVAWRADGLQLASAGADAASKIWDYASGEQQRTIEAFSKEVTAIDYVGTSHRVMTTCGDHYVRMFNADNGNQDRIYYGTSDFLYSLGLTPDGSLVVAGGQDGVLRVWNVESTKLIRSFDR